MNEENQTPENLGETKPGKFSVSVTVFEGDYETEVNSSGIATVELVGIVLFVESILNDLKEQLLDKMKTGE